MILYRKIEIALESHGIVLTLTSRTAEKYRRNTYSHKWITVIKSWASKICRRRPLKNLTWCGLLQFFEGCLLQILLGPISRPHRFKFFKGCFSQMLLGPFSDTLIQILSYPFPQLSTRYLEIFGGYPRWK